MAGIKASDIQYILNNITIQGYQDALGLNHDFLDRLGGFKAGKARIQPKIHYGGNTTAGSFAESGDISTAGKQSRRTLELAYKRMYVTVGVDGLQDAISTNGGVIDIPNLLTEEINDGIEDLLDEINTQLLSDGTGNSGSDISGVQFHVADDNTWGGLARASYAWIQSYIADNAGSNRNLATALMRTVHETLTNTRKSNYNEIWTSSTMRKVYQDLMGDLVRYLSVKTGDVEMEKVTYENRPIVDFAGYASNRFDFVRREDFSVEYLQHKSLNSKGESNMGPFKVSKVAEVSDDATFNIIMYVQMVCKNPWKQGSLKDVQ